MAVASRGTAYEGFFALYDDSGNLSTEVKSAISCKVSVEYELVRDWQTAMRATKRPPTLKGRPLGRLPDLYPFDLLKQPLVDEAHEFVRQIGSHHWAPTTGIYEFKVWGPFTEKVGVPHDWVPEADNPFIAKADKKVATTAWGYSGNELPIRFGCVFMVQGIFTRAGRWGYVSEEDGRIIV